MSIGRVTRPRDRNGRSGGGLLCRTLGAKTIKLIHANITSVDIGATLEELVINSRVLDAVVNDIDEQVVRIVRTFNDAFSSVSGRREVRQLLRSILWVRYQIKDQEVFEKAYNYVEMYY